ncbi:MAG TPA: hypothetical protein VK196_14040 [Magnetospirillum sp.]|nr:hypothetical protein [Magnetospirillum sp.]
MLRMLRTATTKLVATAVAANDVGPARRTSPYLNYMCYRDGQPFMVVNAPSLEHAQFVVAGFSRDHAWMLLAMDA